MKSTSHDFKTFFRRLLSLTLVICFAIPTHFVWADIAPLKPGQIPLGDSYLSPDFEAYLRTLMVGAHFERQVNNQIISGTYRGSYVKNGESNYSAQDVTYREVDKQGTNAQPATGTHYPEGAEGHSGTSTSGKSPSRSGGKDLTDNGTGERTGKSINQVANGAEGFDVTDAIGSGVAAGALSGAIQEVYRYVVFSPARQEALDHAAQHLQRSSVELATADAALQGSVTTLVAKAYDAAPWIENAAGGITPIDYLVPGLSATGMISNLDQYSDRFNAAAGPILTTLLNTSTHSQVTEVAKAIGLDAIAAAGNADIAGDYEATKTLLGVAKIMADVLIGLNPYTSVARDTWEFFSGRSLLTGEPLPTWQRALAGVGLGASLFTMGAASSVGNAIRNSARIFEEGKNLGGVAAAKEAAIYAEKMGKLGKVADQSVKEVIGFSRIDLKNEIKDVEAIVEYSEHWSDAAKQSFNKVAHELKLSPSELAAEAKRLNVTPEVLNQRRLLAIAQYHGIEKFTGNSQSIAAHLKGIDFGKTVEMTTIAKGEKLYQWSSAEGRVGTYFSRTVETPSRLGVGPHRIGTEGATVSKTLVEYTAQSEARALQSTSFGLPDNYSVPGLTQETMGGATQLLLDPKRILFR